MATSALGEPSVMVLQPTTAIRTAAMQPATRAALGHPGQPSHPIRTNYDVTGWRRRALSRATIAALRTV
jgi:hypothetical protein